MKMGRAKVEALGSCEHARVVAENGSSREHDEGAGWPLDLQKPAVSYLLTW